MLIAVVQKMNPRKMAEVMAAMTPEAAERLTVALATRPDARPGPSPTAVLPATELPAIEPSPAGQRR